jgi:N-acetyl sugar amidotransferase
MVSCKRCIYDENTPGISFDETGLCNYCLMIDDLNKRYKTGTPEGENLWLRIVDQIITEGKGKKYDCVIGVSGGTDSSFLVVKAVEWGLKPLAVHYDNTWNSAIATENIRKVLGKLNVDLYTHVVDNKEADDIARSFFYANVPEIDGPTDLALAETLYRAAQKFGVKYILEGHSFNAEGVSPLGSAYIDGGYIKTIHKKYGRVKMKTFPNMTFFSFLKWTLFLRIRKVRPLWYIAYSKSEAQKYLEAEFNWKYYGGHHLENRLTGFNHSVYFPQKFGIDQRNNSLCAQIRAGILTRDQANKIYSEPPYIEPELVAYFKKRLDLTDQEYLRIMHGEKKFFYDYKTYKKLFERLKPIFFMLAKTNLVPMSFYLKYCFPFKRDKR